MNQSVRCIFYLGKGGVGKSTLSAANALRLANAGSDTVLVSMDSAHNLGDIFGQTFSAKPTLVHKKLMIIEADLELGIKKYLKDIRNQMAESYRYLSALNLDKQFDVLKFAPGMEEYAMLSLYSSLIKKYSDRNIIFDMPPTALALRFFNLPKLSLVWLDKLLELRRQIIEKKEIISKIKFGKKEVEFDRVLKNLEKQFNYYNGIAGQFGDPDRSRVKIVTNTDKLSLAESKRIIGQLDLLKIPIASLVVNKLESADDKRSVTGQFPNIPLEYLFLHHTPLVGREALDDFILKNFKNHA